MSRAELKTVLSPQIDVLPPVRRGDVRALCDLGYTDCAIVDGEFGGTLAVSPKEILHSLRNGMQILGGASMGALRAVELSPYGMIGVGQIYDWYRSGRISKEDDVAVLYGALDDDFVCLTVPMVEVIWVCALTSKNHVLDSNSRGIIQRKARKIHWAERTWDSILAEASLNSEESHTVLQFAGKLESKIKRIDALNVAKIFSQRLDNKNASSIPYQMAWHEVSSDRTSARDDSTRSISDEANRSD